MTTRRRQNGAALIVGLILLMVLTILAISAMRTATLDLTMAGNTQFRENAFQLAESGIQATVRNIETNVVDLTLAPPCTAAVLPWSGPVAVPALSGRYETRVCFEGETVDAPGSSAGQFRQLHYRIESRGRTDQRNAEAIHTQGFYTEVGE